MQDTLGAASAMTLLGVHAKPPAHALSTPIFCRWPRSVLLFHKRCFSLYFPPHQLAWPATLCPAFFTPVHLDTSFQLDVRLSQSTVSIPSFLAWHIATQSSSTKGGHHKSSGICVVLTKSCCVPQSSFPSVYTSLRSTTRAVAHADKSTTWATLSGAPFEPWPSLIVTKALLILCGFKLPQSVRDSILAAQLQTFYENSQLVVLHQVCDELQNWLHSPSGAADAGKTI